MLLWSIKVIILLLLWCASVLLCDIQSASFLNRGGSVVELVFFTNVVSCLFSAVLCVLLRNGSTRSMFSFLTNLWEKSSLRRLLLVVSTLNLLATLLMFFSFNMAGMSYVYAVKTTEPLVMCILATEFVQQTLSRLMMRRTERSPLEEEIDAFSSQSRIISVKTWVSVAFVCVGAFLVSGSLKRDDNLSSHGQVIIFGYLLIFGSNCALSLRTMLQKPLLHVAPEDSSASISCRIYFLMSLFGICALFTPALFHAENIVKYTYKVWLQIFLIGLACCTYQICNGMVLFYVTPVSYAVLKQARVILIFLFSAYYFSKSFASITQLIIGLLFLIVGSWRYIAN